MSPRSAALAIALSAACLPGLAHITSMSSGSRGPGRIGTGTAMLEVNDSLKASADFFAYLSDSRAAGWRTGDPLGAGGKMPLTYNRNLYSEAPFDKPYLYREELRPQYQDFSYLPIWQPTQFSGRLRYRFLPRVWGSLALDYTADPVQIKARDALQSLEVSELLLKWAPEPVPGLSFSMGNLRITGAYFPVFDQLPLENFRFSGVRADYERDLGARGSMRLLAAAGREFLGRTLRSDEEIWRETELNVFLDGVRERQHFFASAQWVSRKGFYLGALGGYQVVAGDSTVQGVRGSDQFIMNVWPASRGWLAGGEAGYRSRAWDHRLAAGHGRGDVQMGWSGPDAVFEPSLDSTLIRFSRQGSALSQAIYGFSYRGARFRLEGGAWGQVRDPARTRARYFAVNGSTDTMDVAGQAFRAAKLSLQPSVPIRPYLSLGVRYDAMLYPDAAAHSNTVEKLTDRALRPLRDSLGVRLEGPSPWDREAVDCHLVTPFLEYDSGGGFHIRGSWTGAWYAEPVWRQGSPGRFHANTVLAAWITYRLAMLDAL